MKSDTTTWDKKYPLCFKTPGTCIGFGVECGRGWYPLLERLLSKIESRLESLAPSVNDSYDGSGFSIDQIKEKYGTLRFYVSGASKEIYDMIHAAEKESATTCEQCGDPGVLCVFNRWYATRCQKCASDALYPYSPVPESTEDEDNF